jgi:hypothetical protein
MIGNPILGAVVRAAILSTRVQCEGTMPVCLFVVAPFEQGKTRLVLENSSEDSLILTDCTGMGLLEALQMNPKATTVIINDLSVATGHRASVNKLTISILNSLAEEGTYKIAMPKMQHLDLRGRKVNIIACCVPELVEDRRNWWYKSGFMSRMLTLHFQHSINLQLQIHKAIKDGDKDFPSPSLVVPEKPVRIAIPAREAELLHQLASLVYGGKETGYRKHKQIRSLAAGHCIGRGGTTVNEKDLEFIKLAIPYLKIIEGPEQKEEHEI